jgi:wyosine [tRNA(Phe)-imidazoG37] synthetase (radical SAM superfamily)
MKEDRSVAQPCLPLQEGVIYGPVNSRRLGRSLGVNPLGNEGKHCNFNCVYCQYGWTPETLRPENLPTAAGILRQLRSAFENLKSSGEPFDCITFAGNGEPTLHPEFAAIVEGVLELRGRFFPEVRVGILSNSATLGVAGVREALLRLDRRYMKLDAGTDSGIDRVNRPRGPLDMDRLTAGLRELRPLIVQSIFIGGPDGNDSPEAVASWIERLKAIGPEDVYVYSVSRGTADKKVQKVLRPALEAIAARVRAAGLPARVFD